jgi:hypothetical protein
VGFLGVVDAIPAIGLVSWQPGERLGDGGTAAIWGILSGLTGSLLFIGYDRAVRCRSLAVPDRHGGGDRAIVPMLLGAGVHEHWSAAQKVGLVTALVAALLVGLGTT